MMKVIVLYVFLPFAFGGRISFTSCHDRGWQCSNNIANDIVYTCPADNNENILHLKDHYTQHITSLTVQRCKRLKVILDCSVLQRPSRLQAFKVKDCERLEFTATTANALIQAPSEVTIENVREIISLPRGMFKSPATDTELKCLGTTNLKKIRITDSKINIINTKAISNVSGLMNIELENITIVDMESQAIEAAMNTYSGAFKLTRSRLGKLRSKAIAVRSNTATITDNVFGDIPTKSINITADYTYFTRNAIRDISNDGLIVKSGYTDISNNQIHTLKSNALASIKCSKKITGRKLFSFSKNLMENVESNSLFFDYQSCKSAGTPVSYRENKLNCNCRNIAFLGSGVGNAELTNLILDLTSNNTCLLAPCYLPVEVVKMLLESKMCQINLDPQVVCLLYNDKTSKNNEVTDEDVTEAASTFYLIRQASGRNGDASAAITAINKDDLLNDSHMNMTNRTTIKVVFDSSRDFVETLRSTSSSRRRQAQEPKTPPRTEYTNRCVGAQCRTNAYDKQKALDFYKYVYAQLRPPKTNTNTKT
ncbi:uncharacterized protein LOC125232355 [Leguminivora glycinivorella]|uniref:uncharacterized protein LOC125232355 n=1 Tax=Leguminivora glycinivorella TaxID=1035111 RepID=UPI00200CB7E8|nr:uncharacterized protein LOC125232355 [Leguminivora glycinivorella]